MSTILVVTEINKGAFRKPSFEVVSEARRIADTDGGSVTALVIGSGVEGLAAELGAYGADAVLTADSEVLAAYNPDNFRDVILKAVESKNVDLVLLPATPQGRDVAARIGAKLDAGVVADCVSIQLEGNQLVVERPVYAGKAIAKVAVKSAIKIASLRPNIFAATTDAGKSAAVEVLALPEFAAKQTLKEFKDSGSTKVDLTEADSIVTGGRGMKDPANFQMLEDLAAVLGGVVGATRAAVDAGWCPQSDQVGQTGKTVSPNLYMMFGASGSIQHWAGMSGAKCIVAVNRDEAAPIMEKADYSIVGDLFEVLPVLIEEVKKVRG